jgi:mRNA interferase MazF
VPEIHRGQIWWMNLPEPRGSEPGYRRPVVVLQRDEVNSSRLPTMVVCALTSNVALASARANTLVPKSRTGLDRDSVANTSQIATVNKIELEELIGVVPRDVMERVDAGVRWFLGLE